MPFKLMVNTEHDAVTYVKIQIAGKAIHEAALLAYYCDGRRKQQFHEEMEREIDELLTILGIDIHVSADTIDERIETLEYRIENLRAGLRAIERLPPRERDSAWTEASNTLREDDEFAAHAAKSIR